MTRYWAPSPAYFKSQFKSNQYIEGSRGVGRLGWSLSDRKRVRRGYGGLKMGEGGRRSRASGVGNIKGQQSLFHAGFDCFGQAAFICFSSRSSFSHLRPRFFPWILSSAHVHLFSIGRLGSTPHRLFTWFFCVRCSCSASDYLSFTNL